MSATTAAALRQTRSAAITVLLLASTLTVMATAAISPVIAVIRDDLEVSGTAAGLLLTTHCLVIAVVSPLTGMLIDRYGVRRPLAAGLVLYGVAGGAGMWADSYAGLLLTRVAFGVGAAFVFTGSTVALLSVVRGTAQERVMGWRSSATAVGALSWPLIGGALGALSWHAPFGVYLVGIVVGAAALSALPEDRPAQLPAHSTAEALRFALRRPVLLGYYGLFGAASLLLYALVVFLPLRFAELGVHDPFHVALLSLGMSVTMIGSGFAYPRIRAQLGHDGVLRLTYATWTLTFLVLAGAQHVTLVALASTLFGIGMGISLPTLTILLGDASPPERRGTLTALSGSALFLGQFASPLVLGPLADATSITTAYLGAAAVAGGVLVAVRRQRRPENAFGP